MVAFREVSATCVSWSNVLTSSGQLGVREHRPGQHLGAEPGDGRELSIAQVGVAEICIGEVSRALLSRLSVLLDRQPLKCMKVLAVGCEEAPCSWASRRWPLQLGLAEVGPFSSLRGDRSLGLEGLAVPLCSWALSRRRLQLAVQVGPLQLGAAEVGPLQLGPLQVGPLQLGSPRRPRSWPPAVGPLRSALQLGPDEVGPLQLGPRGWPRSWAPEDGVLPAQVGPGQISPEVIQASLVLGCQPFLVISPGCARSSSSEISRNSGSAEVGFDGSSAASFILTRVRAPAP